MPADDHPAVDVEDERLVHPAGVRLDPFGGASMLARLGSVPVWCDT